MKKILLMLFLFAFSVMPCTSQMLKGGVSYTVDSARKIAFDGVLKKIDMSKYQEYMIDKNFKGNMKALSRGKKQYKDGYLTVFSDGDYGVRYKSNMQYSFYYKSNGQLDAFDYTFSKSYPKHSVLYDKEGILDSTRLSISKYDSYIFDINKNLVAHWIGKNCYNEKGELVLTRD